ncbi:MAG: hypothetical protein ACI8PT_001897 [Gammaproteobacteria bacterium]|jgi:hypothetical protein
MLARTSRFVPALDLVDIHSCILPDVDVGANSLESAIAVLRLAEKVDVVTQLLAPQIGRHCPNRKADLEDRFGYGAKRDESTG